MKTQKAYITSPNHCPVCDSPDIIGSQVSIDGTGAYQSVMCCDCDAEWTDEYKLVGYELDAIETGKPVELSRDTLPDM